MRLCFLFGALLGGLLSFSPSPVQSQAGVELSLGLPNWLRDQVDADFIATFEAEHPSIRLNVVETDLWMTDVTDGEQSLADIQGYAIQADVLFVNYALMTPLATRAGYFLDLNPLIEADVALDINTFYPAVRNAFHWDQATWGLPLNTDIAFLAYDPVAFDTAGLAYPDAPWTITDFADAIRRLALSDPNGEVIPGIGVSALGESLLLLNLLKAAGNDWPSGDHLPWASPNAHEVLATWAELTQANFIGTLEAETRPYPLMALTVAEAYVDKQAQALVWTPLPGETTAVVTQGFAVSAGTPHLEAAYQLAQFLTTRPELLLGGRLAARQSLENIETVGRSAEQTSLIRQALNHNRANANSEIVYMSYLNALLTPIQANSFDLEQAFTTADDQLHRDQQLADTIRQTSSPVVETPPNTGAATDLTLAFGLASEYRPVLPNQDQWDRVIEDFSLNDPQVSHIELSITDQYRSLEQLAEDYDCFTMTYPLSRVTDLSRIYSVDPLLAVDPAFDADQIVGNVLALVERENQTWGVPLSINPMLLWLDTNVFAEVGLAVPNNDWTVNEFAAALDAVQANLDEVAPFVPWHWDRNYILVLIAGYGGIPIDYRTDPPTINFTSPETIQAIQQVLDLAKADAIFYQRLSGDFSGVRQSANRAAMGSFSAEVMAGFADAGNGVEHVLYPRGSEYTGVSYEITSAFISSRVVDPEPCYRWISTIRTRPELLLSIPADKSLLEHSALLAVHDAETLADYRDVIALLEAPQTLYFPTTETMIFTGDSRLQHWLFEVFDAYIENDIDLERSLQGAEASTLNYVACLSTITAATQDELQSCAQIVDPE